MLLFLGPAPAFGSRHAVALLDCVGANPNGGITGWGPLVHPETDGKGWDLAGRAEEGSSGRAMS